MGDRKQLLDEIFFGFTYPQEEVEKLAIVKVLKDNVPEIDCHTVYDDEMGCRLAAEFNAEFQTKYLTLLVKHHLELNSVLFHKLNRQDPEGMLAFSEGVRS